MIHIIGVGPERKEWIPPIIYETVEKCEILIGSSRIRNLFIHSKKGKYYLSGSNLQTMQLIKNNLNKAENIGVLVADDPGFFGILTDVKIEFPDEEINIYPAISNMQLMFSKAKIPWHDALFFDLNEQELSLLPRGILRPITVVVGKDKKPQQVAQLLLERGINPQISVGYSLGKSDEFFEIMDAVKLSRFPEALSNAILIIHSNPKQHSWQSPSLRIGIPDKEFVRGEAPMTKAEIRVQVLSKAQISLYDYILDVGSGTGSISIEAAAIANEGMVFAIDNDIEAQQLIKANMRKFAVSNLKLVSGTAPEVFSKIPPVNVCIINGTRCRLKEVLEQAPLIPGGRVVMTAISLEKVSKGLEILKSMDYEDIEVVSIQAIRWPEINKFHIAQSINQVFVISAKKISTK